MSHAPSSSPAKFSGFSKSRCYCPTWLSTSKSGHTQLTDPSTQNINCGGHRLIYRLLVGKIRPRLGVDASFVLHRCGNASCINPYHLYLGDKEQNDRDARLHRGDRRFKLSISDIKEIENSRKSTKELSLQFGVHHQTIAALRRGHYPY
ncbi:HNH endonuclease [Variovorax sp. J31P207]|uniref:HNH endonuclease n=1 Tax=Variovorax sp. J31P207 TaxID=3053510 RepID=UPI0033658FFE